jgi:hypothetical protein
MRKAILPVCTVVVLVSCLGVLGKDYLKDRATQIVREVTIGVLNGDAKDIRRELDRQARAQTAAFVLEEMPKAPTFPDKFALLEHSLQSVDPTIGGLFCEFGVWKGETVNFIASKTTNKIHGFDSFEGLPETWRTDFEKGDFKLAALPEVRENVKLHKGWFNESVPVWAEANPGPISFIHMDADLYSSTKDVLDVLGDRIVPGTVIQFDEYFNYPGWLDGEFKAWSEFVEARQVKFEYLGYCDRNEQVAVRVLEVGAGK